MRAAGVFGASSIAAGAAGAHGMGMGKLEEPYAGIWKTAVQYQQFHTAALLATPLATSPRARLVAGASFASGILLFSGSNYLVAYHRDRSYGRASPYGGGLFILGWLALALL